MSGLFSSPQFAADLQLKQTSRDQETVLTGGPWNVADPDSLYPAAPPAEYSHSPPSPQRVLPLPGRSSPPPPPRLLWRLPRLSSGWRRAGLFRPPDLTRRPGTPAGLAGGRQEEQTEVLLHAECQSNAGRETGRRRYKGCFLFYIERRLSCFISDAYSCTQWTLGSVWEETTESEEAGPG